MSDPAANAAAAAVAGAKRKRDPAPTLAPAASPSATAAAASSSSSSSDNEPKRARLVAVPVTAADVAHFEGQRATALAAAARALPASASASAAAASLVGWKGARILVDTALEVLADGHVLVHMEVCFDGVSRRLARKQDRMDATAAKHREKKVAQKHKQKAKRHEAQAQKKQLSAQMTAEGKTDDEIRAFFREKYNNKSSGSRTAKQHRAWLLEQMAANALPKVVIDCSFDALMKLEEVCSLAKQIKYIYGSNNRSPKPMHLIISSLTQPHEGFNADSVWRATPAGTTLASKPAAAMAAAVASVGDDTDMKDVAAAAASTVAASSVAALPAAASAAPSAASSSSSSSASSAPRPEMYLRSLLCRLDGFERLAFDRFEEHFTKLPARLGINQSNLVYLTAESPTVLTKVDPAKTYVIGGIVDHNRMKGLCHSLALRAGLATARLPIQEHLVNHCRTVITVNQVFEILLHAQETPEATAVDWTTILKEVLPARSGWKERANKDKAGGASKPDDEEEDEKQQEREDDERNQRLEKQAEAEAGDEDADLDDAEACTDV